METATTERKLEHVIVGVGINVNNPLPKNTKVPPTSLSENMSNPPNPGEVIAYCLNQIHEDYCTFLQEDFEPTIKKWENLSTIKGKMVTVKRYGEDKSFKAIVAGLSSLGELIVEAKSSISKGVQVPGIREKSENSKQYMKLRFEEVSLIGGE
jgi:biotin-(acetyl-CoA carboxylase) ligase